MAQRILLVDSRPFAQADDSFQFTLDLFRHLRDRGLDVWMVSHESNQDALRQAFPHSHDFEHIVFAAASPMQRLLKRVGRLAPHPRLQQAVQALIGLDAQGQARNVARFLIQTLDLQLVYQPAPQAAGAVSLLYNLGAPVVMGPLYGSTCGAASPGPLPGPLTQALNAMLHRLLPGKRQAQTLILADQQAHAALPAHCQGSAVPLLLPASSDTTPDWPSLVDYLLSVFQRTLAQQRYENALAEWQLLQTLDQTAMLEPPSVDRKVTASLANLYQTYLYSLSEQLTALVQTQNRQPALRHYDS